MMKTRTRMEVNLRGRAKTRMEMVCNDYEGMDFSEACWPFPTHPT